MKANIRPIIPVTSATMELN